MRVGAEVSAVGRKVGGMESAPVTWDHPDADPTRDIYAMVRRAHPQQPTSRRPAYVHLPVTLYDTLVAAGTIDVTAFAAAHIIICRGKP